MRGPPEARTTYLVAVTDDLTSEFKVTFGAAREEVGEGRVRLDILTGLTPDDLEELSDDTGTRFSLRPGSVGVGAARLGIELIITYASIPGDILSLVAAGQMIRSVIKKIQSRRMRSVTISDSDTMAAVAAASLKSDLLDQLDCTKVRSVRSLFGGEPPNWLGTNTRHVWAVTFEHETEGYAFVIFMSPSGLVLGHAQVPLESYWDGATYKRRKPENIARFRRVREPSEQRRRDHQSLVSWSARELEIQSNWRVAVDLSCREERSVSFRPRYVARGRGVHRAAPAK